MGFLQFGFEICNGLASFFCQLLVNIALLPGLLCQSFLLLGLLLQQRGHCGLVTASRFVVA